MKTSISASSQSHSSFWPEHLEDTYFLCFDEMNLARVEYYLSEILSIIETRRRVDGRIVTDQIVLDKAARGSMTS